jgi:DNA-binding transcriptional LysR family regulator
MIKNLQLLDLNLLLVFDALMQEQNLSRAAVRLHRSQPAVSNALARLRQQLDQPLFIRTAQGLRPTPQAQALYQPVRQALSILQRGLGSEAGIDNQSEHRLRLSMNDYAQASLLPALSEALGRLVPRWTLSVQNDDARQLVRQLSEGELDLAIDYLNFDDPQLCYEALHEEPLLVIGRQGHPAFDDGLSLAAYQAARHVAVLPRDGRGSPLEIVLGSARVRRQVQLSLPNYLPLPAIVARSDLLATIPAHLLRLINPALPLCSAPLPLPLGAVQVSMIWHRSQDLSPSMRWLREQVQHAARQHRLSAQAQALC